MSDAVTRAEERLLRAEGAALPLHKLRRLGRVSDALVRALAYCGDSEAQEITLCDHFPSVDVPGDAQCWCFLARQGDDARWARGLDPILRACGRDVFVRVLESMSLVLFPPPYPNWTQVRREAIRAAWADSWWSRSEGTWWSEWVCARGVDHRPAVLSALREEVSRA